MTYKHIFGQFLVAEISTKFMSAFYTIHEICLFDYYLYE